MSDQKILKRLQTRAFHGVIFDFDGTILDIKKPLERAIEEVFRENQIEAEMESTLQEIGSILESIQGYPISKILLQSYEIFKYLTVLKHLTFLKKLKVAMKIFAKFQTYSKEAHLFPGTKELISYLSKTCNLFIVSHNKTKNILEALQREGIDNYFEGIYGADMLPALKPSPDALLPPLEKSGSFKGKDWLMIGDMPTDIEAGKEAGLCTLGIASGISKRDILAESHPDLLVDSLTELLNLINNDHISNSNALNSLKIKS